MKKIIILALFFSLLLPMVSLAQTAPPTGPTGQEQVGSLGEILNGVATNSGYRAVNENTLVLSAAKFLRAFFSVLGVIFLIIVVYAGFQWMTAGGNEEQVTKAKKLLINGVIGLAIIILAFSITYFVSAALTYSTVSGYPY